MKLLYGNELAEYIKERQAKQVRALRQAHGVSPKLVIVMSSQASDAIRTYVRMKQRYARDILIDVTVVSCSQQEMPSAITTANDDDAVHGVIVQLPLDDPQATDTIVDAIAPRKDVDGLGISAQFDSATAEAIDWLLVGHSVDIARKKIAIVGRGKLVGGPLERMWASRGYDVVVLDRESIDSDATIRACNLVVSATGVPGVLNNGNIMPGVIVVDAGTASEKGVIVGDAATELFDRTDITITPQKGGVGPLTVAVMFDHVIRAARATVSTS
jgi:methylenetetrahydrofolate dehydrogenase (NADP+)/methenyltetrahydrofolate cyclohydrolase